MAEDNSNNNPRNNGSTLFGRLTRLIRGPLVCYDTPGVVRGARREV